MKIPEIYENEGARAYMNGKTISDCPYKNPTIAQVDACRWWISGYEQEKEFWESHPGAAKDK